MVVGVCVFVFMAAIFHCLQEDNPWAMFQSLAHAFRAFNSFLETLGVPAKWVTSVEIGVVAGLAFTTMQIGEHLAAVILWLILAFIWAAKACAWQGVRRHGLTTFLKAFHVLLALVICALLITITSIHRGDEPWSNLQKLWRRHAAATAPRAMTPLITMQITPSGFPVSTPSHSALSILPLHPYQTGGLLAFDNPCGEEHFWPTQEEIDSKPENAHEEVRLVEVTNHSQATMETGKAVFRLSYNDSFGGGCMPPPTPTIYQEDVVSIPTLDQGRAFQFVAVSQTNRCVWLLPPAVVTVKMAGDDSERQVPVRVEPINIPNWANIPFPPTTIKWQGVPARNPGYGIVRSTARCELPGSKDQERKVILDQLSTYVLEGERLKKQFEHSLCETGIDESKMARFGLDISNWHHRVEAYLNKRLGRPYLARFRNQAKPPSSWPCAFDLHYRNAYGVWNSLSSDLERLDEFMKEPEVGR